MFLLSLYLQKTIKNCQNVLAKDLKDKFIGMNIKQKVRTLIQQMNVGIFLNQILLEILFVQLIQITMTILKDLKLEDVTYQKV